MRSRRRLAARIPLGFRSRVQSRATPRLVKTPEEEGKRDDGADRETMVPVAVLFTRLLSFVRAR